MFWLSGFHEAFHGIHPLDTESEPAIFVRDASGLRQLVLAHRAPFSVQEVVRLAGVPWSHFLQTATH